MADIRIIDVLDEPGFLRIPPCADPGFDHRSCDYWEDADRGSKAARLAWFASAGDAPGGSAGASATTTSGAAGSARPRSANPFLDDLESAGPAMPNPFAVGRTANPFATPGDGEEEPVVNPFAPPPKARPMVASDAPRKLQLLGRGLGIAGSYAKILLVDDEPAAYAQFGPLTAYPRAQRTRDLYPALPDSPLPAVITCIATTADARHAGLARRLIQAVREDLAGRGFSAVETYPEVGAAPDATSGASPAFWTSVGFEMAVADARFPVMRRDLG